MKSTVNTVMDSKDAAVIKALAELGIHKQPDLSPEQEDMLKRALDPEEQFLHDVEKLFSKPSNKQ